MSQQEIDPRTTEVWKPIAGYPGYEVSSFGQVRSYWTKLGCVGRGQRKLTHLPKLIGGWRCSKTRYLAVNLVNSDTKKVTKRMVHILVLETFVGSRPKGMDVRHFPDRDGSNSRLDNLQWGTRSENVIDMLQHRTHALQVLEIASIPDIWNRIVRGEMAKDIASDYNVCSASIQSIKSGKSWSHITQHLPGTPTFNPNRRKPTKSAAKS